jgi:hypothetical protein
VRVAEGSRISVTDRLRFGWAPLLTVCVQVGEMVIGCDVGRWIELAGLWC